MTEGQYQELHEEIEAAIASAVPCEVGVHVCKHALAAEFVMPIVARELAARDALLHTLTAPSLLDDMPDPRDAVIEQIRALHTPWYEVNGVRHDMHVFTTEPGAHHVCLKAGDSHYGDMCDPEDDVHYVLACVECNAATDEGEPGYRLWPCETARLLSSLPSTGEPL